MRAAIARRLGAAVALPAALLSCTVDETLGTDALRRVPIVFAVLEERRELVRVFVERSQVGAPAELPDSAFTAGASILARGGDPVCGARVVLYGARGDSVVLREDREPAQSCADPLARPGEYLAYNASVDGCFSGFPCIAIEPGARYRLRVETDLGTVTGETRVPDASDVVITSDGSTFEDIELPTSALREVMTSPGSAFYRVTYGRDPWIGTLSGAPPVVGIDRLTVAVRGRSAAAATRGRQFIESTIADPCTTLDFAPYDTPIIRIAVVDSNYAAFLVAARDRQVLDDRTAPTGVRGGRGVFGASREIVSWWLFPRFVVNDTLVAYPPAPLGRWAPAIVYSDLALPSICMAEVRDAVPGSVRLLTGVTPSTPRSRASRAIAELRRDPDSDEVRATLGVNGTRAGETRPVELSLDGRLRGDTLELVIRQPVELLGREVRYVRAPY